MRKKSILYCLILAYSFTLHGQTLTYKDSLLNLLPKAKEDTNKVLLYLNIGEQYKSDQPDMAKAYYLKARDLSQKINYSRGVVKFIGKYAFLLNDHNQSDSALLLYLQAVNIARGLKDSILVAKMLFNVGITYSYIDDYETAAKYYEEGKKIFEKSNDENIEAQACDILQALYFKMRNFPKAIELEEKALSIFRKTNDLKWLKRVLTNLGTCYSSIGKLDKAKTLYTEALAIGIKTDDKVIQAAEYLNIGDYWLRKGNYDELKRCMDKALALATELQLPESKAGALLGISMYFTYKKDYKLAESFAQESLSLSFQHNLKNKRVEIFSQLSKIEYARQNMKLGEHYAFQRDALDDSLVNENIRKNTINLEKKYETEKKETRIQHLIAEEKIQVLSNQRKKILLYILTGGLLALSVIILLLHRNYDQKQKLQQKKINELEAEKHLAATEAVLKGEEQERTRIAKDLHDGLGGMLSGIKYSFTIMKENLILTPDNHQAFERSMDMLDSSIKEMRRVAHNMMPEALVRFGLNTALKDFCNDINQSGGLKVNYQSIGMESVSIDQTISITLYRIVQELLNNTMKHSKACMAIVQVTNSDMQLSVTVEDDGKGFDTNILKESKGIGWANIQNRVEFLKGKLNITSKAGEGTSVLIELDI